MFFYEICHRIRPNIALAPTWIEVIAVHEADLSQYVSEVRYVHAIKRLTKNNEGVLQVGVLKPGDDTEEERRLRASARERRPSANPPDQGKTSQIPSFLLWPYAQRPARSFTPHLRPLAWQMWCPFLSLSPFFGSLAMRLSLAAA